ncbi:MULTISPECIES: homoserine dehydrogenase [unclassified Curtobacterium]|uniref:homoserine dehydrogenase n=1 Tax=unclassified Curtobacterium TaxID=257496 RepID=UPI0008DC703D|nr:MULTISPECIES: homoserine dehydrogenase [unclassified Curtobacterium]OIH96667.1 homoserine dehydrogenase [Curtobacterium sp. MCBA15_003]OII33307.1 homoserine dehydrogenase [Curtobacterium sp. MMLR14_006]
MTIQQPTGAQTRVALTGARGGYGRTLLAQLRNVADMTPTVLVDPDVDGVRAMLDDLAVTDVAVVPDLVDVDWSAVDVLVEATGRVAAGVAYAEAAIAHGVHVVMVSKEVETVAGVALAATAAAAGVRYLPGDGDQPANLVRLVAWVERVGLEIVALGKSGEYDLVFDPAAGTVTQVDERIDAPGMAELLALGDDLHATLDARARLVAPLKRRAAADHCEMAVVAQYTGYTADREDLHYPVVRTAELADVYAARADGGITGRPGSLDVFSMLRLPDEASFGGGVFVVVRTGDPETWTLLAGKGHVVSRDGRYACVFWPYHLMGVETPLTIAAAVEDTATTPVPSQSSVLAGRTDAPVAAGTVFRVAGHHHEVSGIDPVLLSAAEAAEGTAPFYLLGGARLVRDLPAGHLLTFDDLEDVDPTGRRLFDQARAAYQGTVR